MSNNQFHWIYWDVDTYSILDIWPYLSMSNKFSHLIKFMSFKLLINIKIEGTWKASKQALLSKNREGWEIGSSSIPLFISPQTLPRIPPPKPLFKVRCSDDVIPLPKFPTSFDSFNRQLASFLSVKLTRFLKKKNETHVFLKLLCNFNHFKHFLCNSHRCLDVHGN